MSKTKKYPDKAITMFSVHGITHTRLTNWINDYADVPKTTSFEDAINLLISKHERHFKFTDGGKC